MFFDTHAHLDDKAFKEDRHILIKQLPQKGIENVINIGTNIESSQNSIKLVEQYDFIYASVGIHPLEVKKNFDQNTKKQLEMLLKHPKVVALGEIGLDYHYSGYDKKIEKEFLIKQLKLAKKFNKPVIIHDRESGFDCTKIVIEEKITKGVFHSFSGNIDAMKKLLEIGFYISFSGVITFKNANSVREVAKLVPENRILIETDSPYLTPEPHRGKRNNSEYVKYVAQKIAEIKQTSVDTIAKITNENAKLLFNIPIT